MSSPLPATYFDGRSPQPQPVLLRLQEGVLWIEGEQGTRQVPTHEITWPERQRHGLRVAQLNSGGSLQCEDAAAWDALAQAAGRLESPVVRAQQSWRGTLLAGALLIALAVAGTLWGVPLAARATVALVPSSAEAALGDAVYSSIKAEWLKPSTLPAARQQALREMFTQALARTATPDEPVPKITLHFHAAPGMGPNALALPGGTIVLTDELVALAQGRDDMLIGVLAHEAGHVQARHGLRMVVQATLIGAVTSLAWGDFSTLLAAAPAVLGQMAYSRDFEREADAQALHVLRANRLDGSAMVEFFDRIEAWERGKGGGKDAGDAPALLSSHPLNDERRAFFGARPVQANP